MLNRFSYNSLQLPASLLVRSLSVLSAIIIGIIVVGAGPAPLAEWAA